MDEKTQEFVNAYETLCKQYGLQIVPVPSFVATNHGTHELTVQLQVVPVVPQGATRGQVGGNG